MTIAPDPSKITLETKLDTTRTGILEDLFFLGYTTSDKIIVYKDPKKDIEIVVQFRTLTPPEIRDIFELSGKYETLGAQILTEKIETLARAIKTINDMPLILDSRDREKFEKDYGRQPSALEMSRIILIEKVSSIHIIDALFEEYEKFSNSIKENFEDIKKKLKNPSSSS